MGIINGIARAAGNPFRGAVAGGIALALVGLAERSAGAAEVVLAPGVRALPGTDQPTPWLLYRDPTATGVVVCGIWSVWSNRHPMTLAADAWRLDTRPIQLPFGTHEYKFIVNGKWETGANRMLYAGPDGLLGPPSALIHQARVDDTNRIVVEFNRAYPDTQPVRVSLLPPVPLSAVDWAPAAEAEHLQGYRIQDNKIAFIFDEQTYGVDIPPAAPVVVAGNFTGWRDKDAAPQWRLHDNDNDGVWTTVLPLPALQPAAGEQDLLFKFVIRGKEWLPPPKTARNRTDDGSGNTNLRVDTNLVGSSRLQIVTAAPLAPAMNYLVTVQGVAPAPAWRMTTPGAIMDQFYSDRPLGVFLDKEQQATTYRLYAPRASSAYLTLFPTPEYERYTPAYKKLPYVERYPLWRYPDGVWEITLLGLDTNKYYSFNVDGPRDDVEGFWREAQIGDPYARAAAHAENNTIVMDPDATNEWFAGWSDGAYTTCPPQDVVLYETHIRHFTKHPSSGVPPPLQGKYEGILATEGLGTGLDHLKQLGVNTIELMPHNEFNNGPDSHNWGYSPVFYFAPEASFGRAPLLGSQYYEYKRLVNELHRRGFGVIMDIVFNHVGSPNIFHMLDKKYYFRLTPQFEYINFSGCGNDVRTEAPMMRRLMVDSIVYWMKEHHLDGFRFDLAELIDMDTMDAMVKAARAINPNVLMISEPWSFRGENKHQLKGTPWAAWNNDFRYAAKDFVMGKRNRAWLMKNIFGSVQTWAATPLQPINYLESHDDMALADEFCTRPDRNGMYLQHMDVAANRLAATILFTSLGIPMITEGQEYLRSKRGFANTYDKGDALNSLNWDDRNRPLAAETLEYYKGLIRLRQSPPGRAFRLRVRPPDDYYQWIVPRDNDQALGYGVNVGHRHPGAAFIVLLNASSDKTTFAIPFPAGRWRMVSDGLKVDPAGLPGMPVVEGGQSRQLRLPAVRAAIFMDGF